jgi:hypothetical protein
MSLNPRRVAEEKARFEAGERQELEAKLAPIMTQLSATLKKADALTRLYWSQNLKHLAKRINDQHFEADHGVTFSSTEEQQSGARGRAQYEEFVRTLPTTGFILSDAGAQRLLYFVLAQALSENHADMANPETWRIGFDRLYQLGCFDEAKAEIGYDGSQRVEEPVVEQPAPAPTIEGLNLSTKAGEKIARDIVSTAVFGPDGDAKILFGEWLDSLAKNFEYMMPEEVQREVINWFQKNNKSFLSYQAYDQCRINLVRRGLMPSSCLTASDRLSMSIEQADTRSYEGRRKLSQEIADMMRLK